MNIRILSTLAVILSLIGAVSIADAAGPFDKDTPYQQAVPNFLEEITTTTSSVKDPAELDAINTWALNGRNSLPEFLDDLLAIAQQLEDQGTPEFIFDKYGEFADKWNTLAQTYPGLAELDPLLTPIIDQLFAGLPQLQPPASDNPLGGFYDLYQAMLAENPWGLGEFFRLEPLPETESLLTIDETLRERRISGVKSRSILYRDTRATINGLVVFFERIRNNNNLQRFVRYRDPTIIHEIIPRMKAASEDPDVIAALEDLAELIDLHLQSAVSFGVLDACSYAYMYRKAFGTGVTKCVDKEGNVQTIADLSRYDPWDDVRQTEITEGQEFTVPLTNVGMAGETSADVVSAVTMEAPEPILEQYQKGFQAPAQTYVIGILFPAYLLSVIGFFRGL